MSVKLPKQWKHWCRSAKLVPHSNRPSRERSSRSWLYLKGHGRMWRVNCHNAFQCGDTYADFDRWALCCIHETPCPTNRAEFLSTVDQLLTMKRGEEQ